MSQKGLKTPISYYGGKQMMVKDILPLIPDHLVYTEPFFGGGAIFFAKEPSKIEVINDVNHEVINFYKVAQSRIEQLQEKINETLHSRELHARAHVVYQYPALFDDVTRAWAFWVLSSQGFACKIGGSWGYDKTSNSVAKKVHNGKARFGEELKQRIEMVQIECTDAINVITSRDREEAFHYCDPPYFNSDCGHYKGYTRADFERLLHCLANVKGKFLLSSYPSEILEEHTERYGWYTRKIEKQLAISAQAKGKKVEVLTANYPI
jgi:DNA adenine methylase